jgi:hypothetical protein
LAIYPCIAGVIVQMLVLDQPITINIQTFGGKDEIRETG